MRIVIVWISHLSTVPRCRLRSSCFTSSFSINSGIIVISATLLQLIPFQILPPHWLILPPLQAARQLRSAIEYKQPDGENEEPDSGKGFQRTIMIEGMGVCSLASVFPSSKLHTFSWPPRRHLPAAGRGGTHRLSSLKATHVGCYLAVNRQ